ncbi:MAG: AMP-binding protein [Prolixibacteraceae bacterium]|jgi:long-chain acyl-CoA synthetase|nr:AMP-binding protein [Prolixibacteraceae bacterium]
MTNQTLRDLFYNSVEKNSSQPSLGFVGEDPLTYNQVKNKVEPVAAYLQKQGIQEGDKIGIYSENQPNWGVAYFAAVTIGAVAVPLLPDFHEDEVENIINHSEAKVLFVSEGLFRKLKPQVRNQLNFSVLIDNFSLIERDELPGDISSLESIMIEDEVVEPKNLKGDDLASIIYTSGTTGKSKGVMLSHKNLVFTAEKAGKIHPMGPTDRLLSILPLSHTYENSIAFILPFSSGASISYLRKPPIPAVLLPALKKVKPTIMLSVPLIIEKVYKNKVLKELNSKFLTRSLYKIAPTRKLLNYVAGKKLMETFGGQMKFFGIGGAKLDSSVEKFLIEAKFPYAIGYGLTETAPLLAGFDSFSGKYKSTGPAMEGVTLKINDPDPVTGQGEIWAKGDNVMQGYYKEPELTAEVLTDDRWFKTGDLGCFDESGYLFIKGRLKNMIVGASGENIYPEEIEAVINRFKHVVESVVVQKKGRLVAMVYFNMEEIESRYNDLKEQAGQYVDRQLDELSVELQQFVNSRVNKYSRVQVVIAHATPFEKTATKKIKRFLYY